MASHLDLEEQEQLDELKHFWKRWGDLITWGLIAVLGGYAAWMGWQSYTSKQAMQSAALYDTVERAAMGSDMALLDRSVTDIKDKFASTTYAQQAALLAARVYQDKNRKADAKVQLTWVAEKASDEGYQALTRLRLASLLIDDKAYDEARKQLSAKTPDAFAPLMADRLGDLAMLQSQPAEAVQHYKNAWKGFEPNAEYRRLVAVKLAALGAAPEEAPVVESKK
ncbi:tetratricopeptide repeat protein [Limnohabitans sp.]|uniref:YfgM family protein n=1 Tax=Limnohabitans sp. TaxID=1907725 RepID=UPI00286F5537|nr:tetratricopeptide repeat protein [Limnohabitans sp.]